jgi:Bacterial SH3 domain
MPAHCAAAHRIGLAVALLLSGCAYFEPSPAPSPACETSPDTSVYERAAAERAEALESENQQLRADLRAAEETLLAIESGMRSTQRRAEAVSRLAEARIQVDRAAARAPWLSAGATEARAKLDEAERQLAGEHFGSAIFFVSRASRIAASLDAEADRVSRSPGARRVKPERVNLRAGPSTESAVLAVLSAELPVFVERSDQGWSLVRTPAGQVGWLRSDLIAKR